MEANPYKTSATVQHSEESFDPRPRFPFWTAGPLTGASVGLVHVTATALAWALHSYPDFLLRSGGSTFLFAVAMSIGGAMFGIPYAGLLAICSRKLDRSVRPRLHFWFAILASFAVTYVAAEISLRRRELVSPLLVLAAIIGISFLAALITANRRTHPDPDLR
ncbi:hypothetical protein CA13_10770 [Planctomycetes bacterium CA13]|uniref:Uncharacterized protein n=1 Tax=Novipirellula herctigrandis TaxID=2527986 RepID=A0A5C5YYK3_9BACT|nr:hypothetical protein CA13_10770 [Planctomycetes bacterium CA13]